MTREDLKTINQALHQTAWIVNEAAESGDEELVKLATQIANARMTLWHISLKTPRNVN
jgi:hypothetical protein